MKELDKVLDSYNLTRLNQEDADSPNRPITSKEIDEVIKSLLSRKTLDLMATLLNSAKL